MVDPALATREYRLKIGYFAPTGVGLRKISGRLARPHQPFFFSEKTRLSDLSYGIKIWTHHSFVLSLITSLTDGMTDGRMDRRTEFSSLDRVCITCSALKMIDY